MSEPVTTPVTSSIIFLVIELPVRGQDSRLVLNGPIGCSPFRNLRFPSKIHACSPSKTQDTSLHKSSSFSNLKSTVLVCCSAYKRYRESSLYPGKTLLNRSLNVRQSSVIRYVEYLTYSASAYSISMRKMSCKQYRIGCYSKSSLF